MKKNNYIKTLACGLGLMLMTSCGNDYLSTSPVSSLTAGTSMGQEEAMLTLVGCYEGFQEAYCYGGAHFLLASEIMSDNCFAGGGIGDNTNFQAIDGFERGYVSEANMLEDYWKKYYTTINRCNSLIASENTVSWTNETGQKNIIGQARALRALCYFDLSRLYGRVPLLTAPSVEKVKEAEIDDIYEVILSDLKYAADNISFGPYSDAAWASSNNGLISEWAAKALLARAYLFYTGFYKATPEAVSEADVKSALQDIINNGNFDLLPSFASLWPASSRVAAPDGSHSWAIDNYAGESNKEILFNLKFDSNMSQGTSQNGTVPMVSMRNTTFAPYATGWGVAPVNPALFEAYEDGDTRCTASIIDLAGEGIEASAKFNSAADWRQYTGYTIKKYSATGFDDGTRWIAIETPGSEADWQYKEGQDGVVVRYADVLLMAAEMGIDAQTNLDKIRDRAFGDTKHRVTATKENILNERRLELAFEGCRYWDLLRCQGLEGAANTIQANQNGVNVISGTVGDVIKFSAQSMIQKQGLLLKPANQITLMGSNYLSQNTGW